MNLDHPAGIRAEHENLPVVSEDAESNPVHDDNDAELGHIMIPSLTSRILLYGALTETSHLPLWISAPLDRHVPGVVDSTLRGVAQVRALQATMLWRCFPLGLRQSLAHYFFFPSGRPHK